MLDFFMESIWIFWVSFEFPDPDPDPLDNFFTVDLVIFSGSFFELLTIEGISSFKIRMFMIIIRGAKTYG